MILMVFGWLMVLIAVVLVVFKGVVLMVLSTEVVMIDANTGGCTLCGDNKSAMLNGRLVDRDGVFGAPVVVLTVF